MFYGEADYKLFYTRIIRGAPIVEGYPEEKKWKLVASDMSSPLFETPFIEILCGPCNTTRISSQANIHCPTCKEVFCYNCCKIHRMKELSRNHRTLLLCELDAATLREIKHQQAQRYQSKTRSHRRFGPRVAVTENAETKAEYMNQLAEKHDHDEEDLENEMFCKEHTLIFCNKCPTSHFKCAGICTVEQAANEIKEKGELTELTSKYKKINKYATIMAEDRRKEQDNLQATKEKLLPQLKEAQMRGDSPGHVEKETERQFISEYENNVSKLQVHLDKCCKIQQLTKKAIDELYGTMWRVTQKSKSKFVKTFYRSKIKYPVYEKCLKEIFDDSRSYTFQLKKEDNSIAQLQYESKALGLIRKCVDQSRLPPFLSTESKTPFVEKSLKREKNVKLWGLGIFARAGISALKCTSTSLLITVNRTECEVRVFKESGWTFACSELSSLPWDLALLSDTKFVVTLPGEHKVIFFKLNISGPSKIVVEKELDVKEECWGIENLADDKFIGTFEPWTRGASLKIFNGLGEVEVVIKLTNSGENIFRSPQHVVCDKIDQKIYVSDGGKNAVFTVNFTGQVLGIFSDPLLSHPTGMTLDHQGNLYICGKNSKNIVRKPYSPDKKATDILAQNDVIADPRALCFYSDGETLLVACSGSAQLYRFQMS